MNSQVSMNSASSYTPIKLFRYRWVVLLVFGIVAVNNLMQLLQFSIIANVIRKYYDVESLYVDMTVLIVFISYIVLFYPVTFLIEKYSLKFTVITATVLTLAGNLLKLVAIQPDRFWLILLAQFLIAIGQVYILSIPSKLATTWFGSEEVSTACAIAILFIQLGGALGCVQSPFIVSSDDNDKVKTQLFDMFLYQSIASICTFVLVLICKYTQSKPKLPPSQSQLNLLEQSDGFDPNFFANVKRIAKDKNFWFIVMSLGLGNGVLNAFGVVTNTLYLNFFPNGESDIGVINLITIITGGCIGSMVFGIILDKTHLFKKVSFGILAAAAITFVFFAISMELKNRIATFLVIPMYGFFITPSLIVGFEYLVEVTYPIPEACSTSIFNAVSYFQSILVTLLLEALFPVGYLYAFIAVFLILCGCAFMVLMVNSNLKRRDANLKHNEVSDSVVNSYSSAAMSTSTTVTIAKF